MGDLDRAPGGAADRSPARRAWASPGPCRAEGLDPFNADFFPDGKRILFTATEAGHGTRLYVRDVTGGKPRAITPEGYSLFRGTISPDGEVSRGQRPGSADLPLSARGWRADAAARARARRIAQSGSRRTAARCSYRATRRAFRRWFTDTTSPRGRRSSGKNSCPRGCRRASNSDQPLRHDAGRDRRTPYSYLRVLSYLQLVEGLKMTLAVGSRLGPYEILAPIGAGGMGEVYRARDERLKRDVAVKVLPASYSQDADRLRRFEQEAQAAGALNHPNITAVYDLGSHAGAPYIVTELLEGETLRARMSGGAIAVRKATRLRDPDREGARGGAREGDRPSGPEAREPVPDERRAGEDPRLRPGEADAERERGRAADEPADGARGDGAGRRDGHARATCRPSR